jgi:hypothetical protein
MWLVWLVVAICFGMMVLSSLIGLLANTAAILTFGALVAAGIWLYRRCGM